MTARRLRLGGATADLELGVIRAADGRETALRPKTAEVLRALAARPGELVTKEALFDAVWPGLAVVEDSLVQCVSEIRAALGEADRGALRTVPKRGYLLAATLAEAPAPAPAAWPSRRLARRGALGLAAAAALGAIALALTPAPDRAPSVALEGVAAADPAQAAEAEALARELRVALGRFREVRLVSGAADFRLAATLSAEGEARSLGVEVTAAAEDDAVVHADAFAAPAGAEGVRRLAARAAAAVASPLTGFVPARLADGAARKPAERMARWECYAYAVRVHQSMSDAAEPMRKAHGCLDALLSRTPDDVRATALKGALYALQYQWGAALAPAEAADPARRRDYAERALALAARAERLSFGDDWVVPYALSDVHFAACDREKVRAYAQRALALNPDDPMLLGYFANSVPYLGDWDLGVEWARRALELEPARPFPFWWWPIAKQAWRAGDYEAALDAFSRAHDENHWLAHVHMAATLPWLGRFDEARAAVARLQALRPGVTREDIAADHRRWCFDEAYIAKETRALALAGLPSRDGDGAPPGPSVAVLPFSALTDDARSARLARGLVVEVAGDLARNRWIRVAAPEASALGPDPDPVETARRLGVEFVLSGAVQAEGDDLRIAARLTEAASGEIVWSERWTRPAADLFAVQDDLIGAIDAALAGAYSGAIVRYGRETARRRPTESLDAYELFLLGIAAKHRFTREGYEEAVAHLRRAVEIDPGYTKAWSGLAIALAFLATLAADEAEAEAIIAERAAATRGALAADPDDPDTLTQANWLAALEGDPAGADRAARRAVALAPANADVLAVMAWTAPWRSHVGADGVAWAERAVALNPLHPKWYAMGLAIARFGAGDDAGALAAAAEAPDFLQRHLFTAASLALLGREAEAKAAGAELRARWPGFTLRRYERINAIIEPFFVARLRDGAVRAGIPLDATAAVGP